MPRKKTQAYTEEFRRVAIKRSEKLGVTQAQVGLRKLSPQRKIYFMSLLLRVLHVLFFVWGRIVWPFQVHKLVVYFGYIWFDIKGISHLTPTTIRYSRITSAIYASCFVRNNGFICWSQPEKHPTNQSITPDPNLPLL